MTSTPTGIDVGGRVIYLEQLQADLQAGGIALPHGLAMVGPSQPSLQPPPLGAPPVQPAGAKLFAHDAEGNLTDLPPEAGPIVAAYTPA